MFKKLKQKFILTNILISTAVLLVAFSSIYLVAANDSHHRDNGRFEPSLPIQIQIGDNPEITREFNEKFAERIEDERSASLKTLLISLIVTGITVESVIAIISILLAERSIRPVRDAYNAQKDFIANASHEIKTPLAVIQANLEAADIKNNKWIKNAMEKVSDLAELNNQLLALAKSESIETTFTVKEISPLRLTMNTISAFNAEAEKQGKNIAFSSDIPEDYKTKLNRAAFEQILNIYIDNGIKYSKNTVNIEVKKDRVHVISDGKPIPETKLPHLFERFYQVDKTTDGVGLGLAIAKSVAEKNGWEVSAHVDKDQKTNVFVLKFK